MLFKTQEDQLLSNVYLLASLWVNMLGLLLMVIVCSKLILIFQNVHVHFILQDTYCDQSSYAHKICTTRLYNMCEFIHGFAFIPWQVSCEMPLPRCSQPPRVPCCPGEGWSSWPGCWEEMTPWDWCPSPPVGIKTGWLESVFSLHFIWKYWEKDEPKK